MVLPKIRVPLDQLKQRYNEVVYRQEPKMIPLREDWTVFSRVDNLRDVVHQCCIHDGQPLSEREPDNIRTAITGAALGNLFSETIGTEINAGFDQLNDTTDWVRSGELASSKIQERLRLSHNAAGRMQEVPRGKVASGFIVDIEGVEEIRGVRFAKVLTVDEQDIIDQNVDMLTRAPRLLGQAARRVRPDLVYATLLQNPELSDDTPIFDASRGNAGEAELSTSSFADAVQWIRTRTEEGINLDQQPKFLIVTPKLENAARTILRDRELNGEQNKIQLRVESRLETGVIDPISDEMVSGSESRWYLIGSGASFEFATVEGRPQIGRFVQTRGTWGLAHDVKWTVGLVALDWRSMYRGNV
ncbi:Mu-like prophage major head subunit gpT family protein [Thalassoglobus sp. JC818]|uniref:phage major capsid protein n=1 Tax=Thalassoglobus sp. JC818 TaxID=3232136 RepID=UPI00345AEE5B